MNGPLPRFYAAYAVILTALLFIAVLTIWVPGHWIFDGIGAVIFVLGAAWWIRLAFQPHPVRLSAVLIPLIAAILIGCLQLIVNSTVNRWETTYAVLKWAVYLTVFFLASQIFVDRSLGASFRRTLLYFGFALSIVSVLQLFTSPGRVFWIFPTEYKTDVLGPFVSPDHYACLMELLLPLALYEALTDKRRMLLASVAAGAMFASVIAGASRAGSLLLTLESVAAVLIAVGRGYASARRVSLAVLCLIALFFGTFAAVVGWSKLLARFRASDPYRGRREMLLSALDMTRAHPWTGFGLGTFGSVYPAYARYDQGLTVEHAHNDWAEWAAEGGLPFLACLIAAAILGFPSAWRSIWAIGVFFLLAHSLVDYPMQKPALALWVFAFLGYVCRTGGPRRARSHGPNAAFADDIN
ncbi:MAG: O-antigen ligase family protein [Bryobacteraceae bacterium]